MSHNSQQWTKTRICNPSCKRYLEILVMYTNLLENAKNNCYHKKEGEMRWN